MRTAVAGLILMLGSMYLQSEHSAAPEPKFAELAGEEAARLDQQRAVVALAAKHYGTTHLTRTKADLPALQKIVDTGFFQKTQTYELQCLGVAFGDVLASELPLHWVMVTDEYGTDPTLRFKKTTIQINALTMISKRIERDQTVNLSDLLGMTREQLKRAEANFK